jgi:hypothetical protein
MYLIPVTITGLIKESNTLKNAKKVTNTVTALHGTASLQWSVSCQIKMALSNRF